MAAAAVVTSRIRLGTGVLIPSNRIAPVAASGLATLNALAPGRIDFGVSTGFTARRTMGLRPVKRADMEEYIRVITGLLAGGTVEGRFEDRPDLGVINIRDEIPLHLSAMGPRARALTAKLGAGWIQATASVANGERGIAAMRRSWCDAGRDVEALEATAAIGGCVLGDGEAADRLRAKAQAGPTATVALHSLVEREELGDLGRPFPPHLAPLLERYREIDLGYTPADARYLSNHRGHLMVLRPEELPLCTAELIRATTFTGHRAELQEQLRALKRAGFRHIGITIRHGHPGMLEDWADVFARV